jgi:hypothetical protein
MRTRVYIAGPMSKGCRIDNLARGLWHFKKLAECGYAPLCPQLTFFAEPFIPLDHDAWLEIDLPWVRQADCVLRLWGESKGADQECQVAEECGIPIFRELDTLLRVMRKEKPDV